MKLIKNFKIKNNELITITGGGGKTSLMVALSRELTAAGMANILTTTAKISIANIDKRRVLINQNIEAIKHELLKTKEAGMIIGKCLLEDEKISGFSDHELEKIQNDLAPVVILNEGDGSKGKPYKFYQEYEPIIPKKTTKLIHVIGAEVLYKPMNDDYIHRSKLYKGEKLLLDEKVLEDSLRSFYQTRLLPYQLDNLSLILFVNKAEGLNEQKAEKICKVGSSFFSQCFWGSLNEHWIREYNN
ncbi:selenium cofactor biosynthesis protein YqeC [Eubacteriaceae bacterium ES3]|nr:selenium cofactor biosynthesis protein YqeC [Eubacteriaceae bacterium ES3]